jgi:hypothetical protein
MLSFLNWHKLVAGIEHALELAFIVAPPGRIASELEAGSDEYTTAEGTAAGAAAA